jgi:AAA15 family ATPase/GTPase
VNQQRNNANTAITTMGKHNKLSLKKKCTFKETTRPSFDTWIEEVPTIHCKETIHMFKNARYAIPELQASPAVVDPPQALGENPTNAQRNVHNARAESYSCYLEALASFTKLQKVRNQELGLLSKGRAELQEIMPTHLWSFAEGHKHTFDVLQAIRKNLVNGATPIPTFA